MAIYMLATGDKRHALSCFLGERVDGPEALGLPSPVEYDDLSLAEKVELERVTGSPARISGRERDLGL